ncbi:patatin [Striga asiatica]|uniref:Patatin n=1 Tax=Striga asiatica TaxID=4170 RepID=A0A5A7PVH1_STRAF|nr:patatin [Striga asiatica]
MVQVFRSDSQAYDQLIRVFSINDGGVRGTIPDVILGLPTISTWLPKQALEASSPPCSRLPTETIGRCSRQTRSRISISNSALRFFSKKRGNIVSRCARLVKWLSGPKYDGNYLLALLKDKLGDTRFNEALTSVVIPTFDINKLQPTIFSTYEGNNWSSLNAPLSNIRIGTSAALTYLPVDYFEIDGGVFANNPEVTLTVVTSSLDVASEKNLRRVVKVG